MQDKYLIVGLGNPGRKYSKTRHNCGFLILDQLADDAREKFKKSKFQSEICDLVLERNSAILAKPQTFMNNSGLAVSELCRFYKIELSNFLVIYDDTDLPFGKIRLRPQGSAGGHNGMKSIISHLGTKDFARLRIGIGGEYAKENMADYVLSSFSKNENAKLDEIKTQAIITIRNFISIGIDKTMNLINTEEKTN